MNYQISRDCENIEIKTMKPCQTAKIMYHTINTIYNAQTLKLPKSSPPCIIIFH